MKSKHALIALAVLCAGLAGCGKKDEPPPPPAPAPKTEAPPPAVQAPAGVSVVTIDLGKSIGADKKVSAPATTFAKSDTIYAVVETTGSGSATLKAKWTYHKGDQTAPVAESTLTITASGPAVSEFHVSKPDGWPAGDYQVEISVDGKPAGSKKFNVN